MIQILIVVTVFAALATVYPILTHGEVYHLDGSYMVLARCKGRPVLLALFYPRPPQR